MRTSFGKKGPVLFPGEPDFRTNLETVTVTDGVAALGLGQEKPVVGLLQKGLGG